MGNLTSPPMSASGITTRERSCAIGDLRSITLFTATTPMRITERQDERIGAESGVARETGGVGRVFEYAHIMRGVEGYVQVLGILPARFGERAGKIVVQMIVPESDLSEGTLSRVEGQCIENYGIERCLALVS
jgi:hypothetical protein